MCKITSNNNNNNHHNHKHNNNNNNNNHNNNNDTEGPTIDKRMVKLTCSRVIARLDCECKNMIWLCAKSQQTINDDNRQTDKQTHMLLGQCKS